MSQREWRGQALGFLAHGGKVANGHRHGRPHGSKPLNRSATFKSSRLAQKHLQNRLNLYFLASISPKPFSSGTKCSNKSYRDTRDLQLCLKDQSLIWPG